MTNMNPQTITEGRASSLGARLLPCPFCGGSAEISQIGNDHTKSRGFEVKCMTWGCGTKKRAMVIRLPLGSARGFAVEAWNRRPTLTERDGLGEALLSSVLLEALKALLEGCEHADMLGELYDTVTGDMLDAANAAIAAAEASSHPLSVNGEVAEIIR